MLNLSRLFQKKKSVSCKHPLYSSPEVALHKLRFALLTTDVHNSCTIKSDGQNIFKIDVFTCSIY